MCKERFEQLFNMRISHSLWEDMKRVRFSDLFKNLFANDSDFITFFALFGIKGIKELNEVCCRFNTMRNAVY